MRQCAKCGDEIRECMGFVKAGDQLEGRFPPRELCGRCVLVGWRWDESSELVRSTEYDDLRG